MGMGGMSEYRLAESPLSGRPWKTYKPADIEAAWIYEQSENGKCRSMRVGFEGNVFYSYLTVIARRIRYRKKVAYVIDMATFSATTSEHQWSLLRALEHQHCRIFKVYVGKRSQDLWFDPGMLRDYYSAKIKEGPETEYRGGTRVRRQRSTKEQAFLAAVANLEEAIAVCNFFGLSAKGLRTALSGLSNRINDATSFLAAREAKLTERRETRWRIQSEIAEANHAVQVKDAIARAEVVAAQYRWGLPPPEEKLWFGHDFALLDTRLDLKARMIELHGKREIQNLKEQNSELWREKWELERAAGGTLEEIKARRQQPKSSDRAITLGDE